MILTIDIGNTAIKAGIFSGNSLLFSESFVTFADFRSFIRNKQFSVAAISSVANSKLEEIDNYLRTRKDILSFLVSVDSPFSFSINYRTPHTLGIDRLCCLEGALCLERQKKQREVSNALIAIDCGTATTVNVYSPKKEFIGGMIAPGITMMAKALSANTEQLPMVEAGDTLLHFGDSTVSSIQAGIIHSTAGLIKQAAAFAMKEFGELSLYLTGGNAGKIVQYLDTPTTYVPFLNMYGIKSVYQRSLLNEGSCFLD